MTFLDMFMADAVEAFDENETRDLAFHIREEQRRHRRSDRKLTLLVWMVSLFFISFLGDLPGIAKVVLTAIVK